MLPVVSAPNTMAVLPSPRWCTTVVSPAASAVCLMISPRMYDSVKRFEPTLSVGAAAAAAAIEAANIIANKVLIGVRPLIKSGQCSA